MNKKFLSAILFGALMVTSTGTFVSCKDYDDDIDNINKELTDIKSKIADLESKVSTAGVYVTKIESVAGGLKVSVSDGTSYNLTIAGAAAGSTVVINKETGEISIDGEPTGFFAGTAQGETGVDMTPYVQDGFWYLYDKEAKKFVKSDYKAAGNAWAVQKGDAVILHIPNEAGEMQEITLPTSSSALANITVNSNKLQSGLNIGWGKAAAAITWAGAKGNVAAGDLLIGTIPAVQLSVSPASYDLSAQELALVDGDGKTAPVTVTAIPNSDDMTDSRAASVDGVWAMVIAPSADVTAENIATAFTKKVGNADRNLKYALAVNGTVITGYQFVIDTQTEAESKTNKALNKDNIDLAVTELIPGTVTTLSVAPGIASQVYDSYIKFEGINASKAEKYEVKVDGMTVTVPATAVDLDKIDATVYTLDVTGAQAKKDVTLTIAKSAAAPDEAVTTVETKVMYPGQSFKVELGETFANLDAIQALAVTNTKLLSESANFFALKDNATDGIKENDATNGMYEVSAAIKYYNASDKEVALSGDVRSIKYAMVTLNAGNVNKKFMTGAKAVNDIYGSFNLTLALRDGNGSKVKDIAVPMIVSEPAFSDYYTANPNAGWNDTTLPVTISNATGTPANPALAFDPAKIFVINKVNNDPVTATSIATTDFHFGYTGHDKTKFEYEASDPTKEAKTYSDMQNLKNTDLKIVNNSELKVKNFTVTTIVKPLAIALYGENGSSATGDVTVKTTFTVALKNVFEGAQLVYYKDNAELQTAPVVAGLIDKFVETPAAGTTPAKKNGLALKYGQGEISVNSTAITNNAAFEKTGFTFLSDMTSATIANIKVPVPSVVANSYGETPALAGNGVTIAKLEGTQGGTLKLTFEDMFGLETYATIAYKNANAAE